MKKHMKNIIAFIISIMLMFVLLLTSTTLFFRGSILNPQTYTNVLDKDKIYDDIYEHIYSNIDYLLLVNNMPEGMLDGIITKDDIIQSVNDGVYYTVGFMKNEQLEIPTVYMKEYEERLDRKINKFLAENSMYLNEDFKNSLAEFKSTVLSIIKSDLELINLNEVSKSSSIKFLAKISSILDSGMFIVGLFATVVILSALFFVLWKRRKARRYAWIGYSFISCGMLIFLVGYSGYLSGFYNNIAIAIPYAAKALALIIKEILKDFTMIGLGVLAIGLCFMSVYWKHLYKKYK